MKASRWKYMYGEIVAGPSIVDVQSSNPEEKIT